MYNTLQPDTLTFYIILFGFVNRINHVTSVIKVLSLGYCVMLWTEFWSTEQWKYVGKKPKISWLAKNQWQSGNVTCLLIFPRNLTFLPHLIAVQQNACRNYIFGLKPRWDFYGKREREWEMQRDRTSECDTSNFYAKRLLWFFGIIFNASAIQFKCVLVLNHKNQRCI